MTRIRSSRKLTDLKWLNLFDVAYTDKKGHKRNWQVATRRPEPKCVSGDFSTPDAVVIVPLHLGTGKIVVTKEYRVPLADIEIGFPAGLVDEGETIEETVRRELKEETGLDLSRILNISPPLYSSAGMTDESVTMVSVECDGEISARGNEGSEEIEVQLMSRAEVRRMCKDPSLKFDAKAWLMLVSLGSK